MAPEEAPKCVIDKIKLNNLNEMSLFRRVIEFKKDVPMRWEYLNENTNPLNEPTLIAVCDKSDITSDRNEEHRGRVEKIKTNDREYKTAYKFFSDIGKSSLFIYQIILPIHHYFCHYSDNQVIRWLIKSQGSNKNGKFRACVVTRGDPQNQNITWVLPPTADTQFLFYFIGPDENMFNKLNKSQINLEYIETHTLKKEFDKLMNPESYEVQSGINKLLCLNQK